MHAELDEHWRKVRLGLRMEQILKTRDRWRHYKCLHLIEGTKFKTALHSRKRFGKITGNMLDKIEQHVFHGRRK